MPVIVTLAIALLFACTFVICNKILLTYLPTYLQRQVDSYYAQLLLCTGLYQLRCKKRPISMQYKHKIRPLDKNCYFAKIQLG